MIIIINNYPCRDYNRDFCLIILESLAQGQSSVRATLAFVPLDVLNDIADGFGQPEMIQTRAELFVIPGLPFYHSGKGGTLRLLF